MSNIDTIRNTLPEYLHPYALPAERSGKAPRQGGADAVKPAYAERAGISPPYRRDQNPDYAAFKINAFHLELVALGQASIDAWQWTTQQVGMYGPSDLLVVDCDDAAAVALIAPLMPPGTPMQRRREGKAHYFVRVGLELKSGAIKGHAIDLKGMGKSWIMLAPSEHMGEGEPPYVMIEDWPAAYDQVPEASPELLVWLGQMGKTKPPEPEVVDHVEVEAAVSRHDRINTLAFNASQYVESPAELRDLVWERVQRINNEKAPYDDESIMRAITTGWEAALRPSDEGKVYAASNLPRYALSDDGHATLFMHAFDGNFKYCPETDEYYMYEDHHWQVTRREFVHAQFSRISEQLKMAAYEHPSGSARRTRMLAIAKRLDQSRFVGSAITTLRARGVAARDWFDSERNVVVFECGTVYDLDAMEVLGEADPTRTNTMRLAASYEPTAACPEWERFLEFAVPDRDTREWVQMFYGMALSGEYSGNPTVPYFFGPSGTGKSTISETVQRAFGSYAYEGDFKSIRNSMRAASEHNADMVHWIAKRLVVLPEAEGGKVAGSQFKKLAECASINIRGSGVTGSGYMHAPHWSIVATGNEAIEITDGVDRRLTPIEMEQKLPPDMFAGVGRPSSLILAADGSAGLVQWVLRGRQMWIEAGRTLPRTEAMQATMQEHVHEASPIAEWFDDCCELGDIETVYTRKADAWRSWKEWNPLHGARIGQREFFADLERLSGRVVTDERIGGKRTLYIRGLSVGGARNVLQAPAPRGGATIHNLPTDKGK